MAPAVRLEQLFIYLQSQQLRTFEQLVNRTPEQVENLDLPAGFKNKLLILREVVESHKSGKKVCPVESGRDDRKNKLLLGKGRPGVVTFLRLPINEVLGVVVDALPKVLGLQEMEEGSQTAVKKSAIESLGDEGLKTFLRQGRIFMKVRKNKAPQRVRLLLSDNCRELVHFKVKDGGKQPGGKREHRVYLTDVSEIRRGQNTNTFEKQRDQDTANLSFSIIYGVSKTLDMVAIDEESWDLFFNGLIRIISMVKDEEQTLDELTYRFVISKWKEFSPNKSALTHKETRALLADLNLKATADTTGKLIQKVDANQNGMLDFEEFFLLVKLLREIPEVNSLFAKYGWGKDFLSTDDFIKFLAMEQQETLLPETAVRIMRHFKGPAEGTLSLEGFSDFLSSSFNEAFDPQSRMVNDEEMKRPLSQYFIASSHNTYLEGNQFKSRSSTDMYIRVLKSGCRCVELDCWDGDDGMPDILHGFTLTTKIKFDDVVRAIRDYAFVTSPYPVILSIENHCCKAQQVKMASTLKSYLGSMLATPLQVGGGNPTALPSPEDLKHKILVKCVINEPGGDDDDSDPKGQKKARVAQELSDITYLSSSAKKDIPDPLKTPPWDMTSVSEVQLKAMDSKALIAYNQHRLTRIYPKGGRVDSSNYDPFEAWSRGCQLVALNYQTVGKRIWSNHGMFEQRGQCGYVPIPPLLMSPGFDPNSACKNSPSCKQVTLTVICARQLPKPKNKSFVDPFVAIHVGGLPCDRKKLKTKVISDNGFNPTWNQTFTFTLQLPEMAVMILLVYDHNLRRRQKLAYAAIPLAALRSGYRILGLKDVATGLRIPLADLFCKFDVA
eukprot:CAMPEP_0177645470 /NCGR_PEP_ID=MMETSP0447-20121125/9264_1 /TAXON_ID=0 /ORGANISM="Stygamoeba regulata, Strain BSH-02190019" /LENGTH=835 /DNA_ID=CAMNT_0019147951 /DNA_START=347 /DNA_END=2854 /DNA_ORIENTATION=-